MSESLIIKDGSGNVKSLQVDSGSNGYIANHTIVSTVTGSIINSYSPYSGWDWITDSGIVQAATQNSSRKGIIINNNTDSGKCYVLVGSNNFGTISDLEKAPPFFSFLLDSGGVYFGDQSTAALEHNFYILSASNLVDSDAIKILVTEIY